MTKNHEVHPAIYTLVPTSHTPSQPKPEKYPGGYDVLPSGWTPYVSELLPVPAGYTLWQCNLNYEVEVIAFSTPYPSSVKTSPNLEARAEALEQRLEYLGREFLKLMGVQEIDLNMRLALLREDMAKLYKPKEPQTAPAAACEHTFEEEVRALSNTKNLDSQRGKKWSLPLRDACNLLNPHSFTVTAEHIEAVKAQIAPKTLCPRGPREGEVFVASST